ncbi:2,4-dienoyl-CoA reductase or related NADH-dependent reductase [Pseudomonas syringae pv. actinidiae]|uniref:2,4-dienoyl-CoA reductase or related NADH-dependent reductase n=1 Tax=Pseudomonas syringae pv. actinidiae TaxID=103796 RepID=A0A2V0QII5_PSESF|nr:2,4-dienoyl-CoA reductase or related NADH-dependent reductase [Pseudomonas syringae pv. actinidiae]
MHRTHGGHIKFTKGGCSPIFTSFTPSDHRAGLNARAQLRRAQNPSQIGDRHVE